MHSAGELYVVPAPYGQDIFSKIEHEDGTLSIKWIAGLTEELPVGNRAGTRLYPKADETRSNAERFAHAWNCHDQLYEALQLLTDEQNGPPLIHREASFNAAYAKAVAAIAKAKGGAA